MKPAPAPNVPGNTEAERFDNAVREAFSVLKEAYLKEEGRLKKLRGWKRRKNEQSSRRSADLPAFTAFPEVFWIPIFLHLCH